MLDIFKRTTVSLVGLAMIVYLFSLLFNQSTILTSEFVEYNMVAIVVLIVLVAFFASVYGIYPITIKRHKTTLLFLGLFFIVFSKTYLINDSISHMYIGDIVIVLGVFIVLFGSTGLLVTGNIKKKEEDKNVEIIEV